MDRGVAVIYRRYGGNIHGLVRRKSFTLTMTRNKGAEGDGGQGRSLSHGRTNTYVAAIRGIEGMREYGAM